MSFFANTSMNKNLPCALLSCALALTACSSGEKQPQKPKAPPPVSSAAPQSPNYSSAHVRQRLISAKEIGSGVREIRVVADFLRENKAPMCSLSGVKLPGDPEIKARQFSNPARGEGEVKYVQLVARYQTEEQANEAYSAIQKRAKACPAKQHVPPKRIRKNFTLFAHDDTWKFREDSLSGWRHIRGDEKHVEPRSQTKFNVYHFTYDYAARGNVLVTSLYYGRTEPKESGEPIVKRAGEVFVKQLQKIG